MIEFLRMVDDKMSFMTSWQAFLLGAGIMAVIIGVMCLIGWIRERHSK